MAKDAIVFGLANPVPEVDPMEAQQHAAVVATGRSDFPNQINNVLAFPGFFRGLLDGGLRDINDEMLSAAANAIANRVAPDQLNPSYIIPSVFDASVAPAVAAAVREVGEKKQVDSKIAFGRARLATLRLQTEERRPAPRYRPPARGICSTATSAFGGRRLDSVRLRRSGMRLLALPISNMYSILGSALRVVKRLI